MSIDKNFLKIKNHLLNEQIELDDNVPAPFNIIPI